MSNGPIVVLHDHLDGGVRPRTVTELAAGAGRALPADDPAALAEWFLIRPGMSLIDAFSRFDLVISLLQTTEALERVAREAVEDLAADGVIHAELRFAPQLHTERGLRSHEVLAAVEAGIDAAVQSTGIGVRLILCAMRDRPPAASLALAELAASASTAGLVVGIDLAGIEPDHPAGEHARAFQLAHASGLGVTVHAGEMDGPHQVTSALEHADPHRIGHGWRLIEECRLDRGRISELGPTASRVREREIPLEICLTSNACLGLAVEDHPLRLLRDAGIRVTINPDDRSITTTTPSRELSLTTAHHGFARHDLAACMEQAALSAFLPSAEREELVAAVHRDWASVPPMLVHLVENDRWKRGLDDDHPAPVEPGGFIHLSGPHQVLGAANRFYRGRHGLVALLVDAAALGDALVWEPGTGTLERFPHLYGPLPRQAVIAEVPMGPGPDGTFLLPEELMARLGQLER